MSSHKQKLTSSATSLLTGSKRPRFKGIKIHKILIVRPPAAVLGVLGDLWSDPAAQAWPAAKVWLQFWVTCSDSAFLFGFCMGFFGPGVNPPPYTHTATLQIGEQLNVQTCLWHHIPCSHACLDAAIDFNAIARVWKVMYLLLR